MKLGFMNDKSGFALPVINNRLFLSTLEYNISMKNSKN